MDEEFIKKQIRDVMDFPIKGIVFKDITTLLKNADALQSVVQELYERYKDKGITKVVGIESRGFVMASILAYKLKAGFVPIRKPGKLPALTWSESYDNEYGRDTIEIHQDAISTDDVVLLHDDVLATGGTMLAAYRLLGHSAPRCIYVNFLVELEALGGRKAFPSGLEVDSLIKC
ncbi:MAG: adenine phosphoribosyltransferase [Porphyromonadaceae bacterium]|nr:adenine phosphoribosyltransferase [Porphyromonadaceae bacterium]